MIHLPDELILHIISYLEPAELVNLQHVSRAFLSLSRDNNLWKSLCFSHSAAERRRRRLDVTPPDIDPRLAELIRAADTLSNTFDTSVHDTDAPSADVQQQRNAGRRRQALIANWDPSYPDERVNWYDDFIQRHAEPRLSWFQDAGTEGKEHGDVRREATGAGVLFDQHGLADKLVAPLDDGRICIWDASAASDRQGTMIAKSDIGLLANRGSDLDYDTRLAQSHAIMTETGAVECVSIDSKLAKGFFAVKNELVETDLNTLQVVSRTPYPFPITALSEAHHSTPLTIGTNWTLHLHDSRKPPAPPSSSSSVRCELISGPADNDFSRLDTGDLHGHVSLSQPGALSILHLPTTREWDGNGDIWVAGRFTSMLNFDRRYFPRLRGTVHSGARLSCLAALPHPFVPHHLRLGTPYANPSLLHDVKSTRGFTLIAAGEYKGKGSLELYGLSGEPERSINSSDSRTTTSGGRGGRSKAYYQNRQTASSSKLLSVAPHGTRLVFADGNGGLKWVERDGSTPVRQLNINDFQQRSKVGSVSTLEQQHDHGNLVNATPDSEASWGDIVQKILPTTTTTTTSLQYAPESTESFSSSLGLNNLVLWTGDGRLGLLGFGKEPPMARDVFEDALEVQGESMEQGGQHQGDKVRERQYGVEMRRALEQQARELRWLRGYGL